VGWRRKGTGKRPPENEHVPWHRHAESSDPQSRRRRDYLREARDEKKRDEERSPFPKPLKGKKP
jgi:hypothetical protein